jgi:hypothetical protein
MLVSIFNLLCSLGKNGLTQSLSAADLGYDHELRSLSYCHLVLCELLTCVGDHRLRGTVCHAWG